MQNTEQGSQSLITNVLSRLHFGERINEIADQVTQHSGEIALTCGLVAICGHVVLELPPLDQAIFSHLSHKLNRFLSDTFNQDFLILQKAFMAVYFYNIAGKIKTENWKSSLSQKEVIVSGSVLTLQIAETLAYILGKFH